MSEPVIRQTSLDHHPGTPQKAIYNDCPSCHHRTEEGPKGRYCPQCQWKQYEAPTPSAATVEKWQETIREAIISDAKAGRITVSFEEPQQVVHSTGATRSSEADGWRYDLIPQRGLERVAATCDEGARKYTPHNWKKGFAWSVMMCHATKHIAKYLLGDKSEDHLAHACWNLLALMDYEVIHPELNDIPERQNDSPQSTGSSSSISD